MYVARHTSYEFWMLQLYEWLSNYDEGTMMLTTKIKLLKAIIKVAEVIPEVEVEGIWWSSLNVSWSCEE